MIIHQINHGQSNLYYYNLQTMNLRNLNFLKDQFMIFAGYQIEKIILLLLDIYLQNSFYDKNGNYINEIVIGKFNKISPDIRI